MVEFDWLVMPLKAGGTVAGVVKFAGAP